MSENFIASEYLCFYGTICLGHLLVGVMLEVGSDLSLPLTTCCVLHLASSYCLLFLRMVYLVSVKSPLEICCNSGSEAAYYNKVVKVLPHIFHEAPLPSVGFGLSLAVLRCIRLFPKSHGSVSLGSEDTLCRLGWFQHRHGLPQPNRSALSFVCRRACTTLLLHFFLLRGRPPVPLPTWPV